MKEWNWLFKLFDQNSVHKIQFIALNMRNNNKYTLTYDSEKKSILSCPKVIKSGIK